MQPDGLANMSLTHGAINVHDVYPCAQYSPHPALTAMSTTSPNHDSATTSNNDDGHHWHCHLLLLHFVLPAISVMAVATGYYHPTPSDNEVGGSSILLEFVIC